MGGEDYKIIEVHVTSARENQMREAIFHLTGAYIVWFCPAVVEGERFDGHIHLSLPAGVTECPRGPLTDKDLLTVDQ